MGVKDLWQLLSPIGRRVSIETLEGKVLAIDASIWITQFVKAMRDEEGHVMKNAHLIGTLRRVLKLLFHRIRPVFVFDGATPFLKLKTTSARRIIRDRQEGNLRKAAERILLSQLKKQVVIKKTFEEDSLANQKQFANTFSIPPPKTKAEKFSKTKFNDLESTENFPSGASFLSLTQAEAMQVQLKTEGLSQATGNPSAVSRKNSAGRPKKVKDLKVHNDEGSSDKSATLRNVMDPNVELIDERSHTNGPSAPLTITRRASARQSAQGAKRRLRRIPSLSSSSSASESDSSPARAGLSGINRPASKLTRLRRNRCDDDTILPVAGLGNCGRSRAMAVSGTGGGTVLTSVTVPITSEFGAGDVQRNEDGDDVQWEGGYSELPAAKDLSRGEYSSSGEDDPRYQLPEDTADIDTAALAALPSHLRKEVVEDARRRERQQKRQRYMPVAADPQLFSQTQLANFLRTSKLNRRIGEVQERLEAEAGGRRIAAQGNRKFILEQRQVPSAAMDGDELEAERRNGTKKRRIVEEEGESDTDSAILHGSRDEASAPQEGGSGQRRNGYNRDRDPSAMWISELKPDEATKAMSKNQSEVVFVGSRDYSDEDTPQGFMRQDGGFIIEDQSTEGFTASSIDKQSCNSPACSERYPIETGWTNIYPSETQFGHSLDPSQKQSISYREEFEDVSWESAGEEGQQEIVEEVDSVADCDLKRTNSPRDYSQIYDSDQLKTGDSFVSPTQMKGPALSEASVVLLTEDARNSAVLARAVQTASRMADWAGRAVQRAIKQHLQEASKIDINHNSDMNNNSGIPYQNHIWDSSRDSERRDNNLSPGESFKLSQQPSQIYGNQRLRPQEDADSNSEGLEKRVDVGDRLEELTYEELESKGGEPRKGLLESRTVDLVSDNYSESAAESDVNLADGGQFSGKLHKQDVDALRSSRSARAGAEGLTQEMVMEVRELLDILGLPYIVAPFEAEAQCAVLEELGLVDGVVTEDSDAFLFGARTVYRNIFDEKKYVEVYLAEDAKLEMGITRNDFVALAYLLGSDYTEGVKGVGIVNAMEVISAFDMNYKKADGDNSEDSLIDGLKRFQKWLMGESVGEFFSIERHESAEHRADSESKVNANNVAGFEVIHYVNKKQEKREGKESATADAFQTRLEEFHKRHRGARLRWSVADGFPDIRVAVEYLYPRADRSSTQFAWELCSPATKEDNKVARIQQTKAYCSEKLGWTESEVTAILSRFAQTTLQQRRIDSFFTTYHNNARFAKIQSGRLRSAVGDKTADKNE